VLQDGGCIGHLEAKTFGSIGLPGGRIPRMKSILRL
jgi:hypothetical protein